MFDPSKIILDDEQKPDENTNSKQKENVHNEDLNNKSIDDTQKKDKPKVSDQGEEDILNTVEVYTPTKVKESKDKIINKKSEIKVPEKKEIIFDVNLRSLSDIVNHILKNKYDFATFEPDSEKVTVVFRTGQVIQEKKYIKYPTYSEILLKAKAVTKMDVAETKKEQEGKGQIILDNKNHDALAKVVPSNSGEKLFFKIKVSENQERVAQKKKKTNLSKMLGFLGSILIILLIIGGGFLSFIVLNAKTVDDVRFFESLGINLSQINQFIGTIVTVTFLLLLVIQVIAFAISAFKALLTKKTYKKKKVKYTIISAILFLLTFMTASAWLFIDKKVGELPNWASEALGEFQIYDNAKLISENEDINQAAYVYDTTNLIGPIDLKFDLSILESNEKKRGFTINKYKWNINGEEIIGTDPILIKTFDKKGLYDVELVIEVANAAGEISEKTITSTPSINIMYLVDISYRPVASGGNFVTFDASDLKLLGKAEWYNLNNLLEPEFVGYKYIPGKPIIDETLIGLYMKKADKKEKILDRVFVIRGEQKKDLSANIFANASIEDDLTYNIKATDIVVDEGAGNIDTFKWTINNKDYVKEAVYNKLEQSSEIEHTFKQYGKQKIILTLTDLAGNTETIEKEIEIQKKLTLKQPIKIKADGINIDDFRYEKSMNEYYIKDLPVPTKLEFDARYVRAENPIYDLKSISWDYDNDGNIDQKSKTGELTVINDGSKTVKAIMEFKSKRNPNDIIIIEESIYIQSIKKDAIIDFTIIKNSDYTPAKVKLDASKSTVTGKNISKFIWDYGDGVKESRDAIVDGHYYMKDGDYDITLSVVTSDGKTYTKTKKLILKPTPQEAKITVSMKRAPAYQDIDFISSNSTGDIIGYFWDFGDGETSSKANPSHFYKKAGEYTVKLKLDYRNNNYKEATQKITVY